LDGERLLAFIRELESRSRALGIPSIEWEDGLVLHALSIVAGSRGEVTAADLGAGIGYSTLWIAAGLEESCRGACRVYAVEEDPELASLGERLASKAPLRRVKVEWVEGDAIEFLASLPDGSLDLAFVDIDKHLYPEALRLLASKLSPGGAAVFHNAYLPAPPSEFYELAGREPWRGGITPTRLGLAVLVRAGS